MSRSGSCSRSSRCRRYASCGPPIRREVARLTDVDHWHHEVLIAFHVHPRIPIGVAEYVRTDRFDTAELAIAISDDWQRHGVGRALVRELRLRALDAGIRSFTATALFDNRGALALIHELGDTRTSHVGAGATEVTVPLAAWG